MTEKSTGWTTQQVWFGPWHATGGRRTAVNALMLVGLALLLVLLPLRPLLGLIVTCAAGLLLLRRPWLFWVGLGIVLPVTSGIPIGPVSLTDVVLASGIALWFADGVRRRQQLYLLPHPLLWILAGFTGVLYLSLLQATDLREAVAELLKWVQFGLVLMIVPVMLPRGATTWLIGGLLLGGLLQGALGLYQFIFRIGPEWFVIFGRFMRASGTFNQPNPYAGYLGLTLPVAVSLGLWWLNRLYGELSVMRLNGQRRPLTEQFQRQFRQLTKGDEPSEPEIFDSKESESEVSEQCVLADSIAERKQTEDHLQVGAYPPNPEHLVPADNKLTATLPPISTMLAVIFYWGIAAVVGLGLLASWSRGGWLGAMGALAVVVALRSRRSMLLSGVVGLTLGGILLIGALNTAWIPAPLVARFADVPAYFGLTDVLNEPLTDENFAIVERIAHWVAAMRMWDQAPWLGVGPGNYAVVYPEVRLPLWEEPLGHAHNIYLNLLAESGLLGILTYFLLWLTIFFWLGKQWRVSRQDSGWQPPFVLGVIGVVVHLSIHNFFDNLFVQGSYLHIALWLAAVSHLSLPVDLSRYQ